MHLFYYNLGNIYLEQLKPSSKIYELQFWFPVSHFFKNLVP